jgi:hypothetical protein
MQARDRTRHGKCRRASFQCRESGAWLTYTVLQSPRASATRPAKCHITTSHATNTNLVYLNSWGAPDAIVPAELKGA